MNEKEEEKKDNIPWAGCQAGAIIVRDLQNGELPLTEEGMNAEDAWKFKYSALAPFQHVLFKQFERQLASHRLQVAKDNGKLSASWKAFEHDQALFSRRTHNRQGKLVFDVHPAKPKLREDVKNKVHKPLSPTEFRLTRPEYQEFTLDEFRDRIYQEIRLQKFYYYLEKERKAKELKQQKLWAKQRQELDKKAKQKKKTEEKIEAKLKAKQREEQQRMDCS